MDRMGRTSLDRAAEEGHVTTVELLCKARHTHHQHQHDPNSSRSYRHVMPVPLVMFWKAARFTPCVQVESETDIDTDVHPYV